jgi:hypothetical protein
MTGKKPRKSNSSQIHRRDGNHSAIFIFAVPIHCDFVAILCQSIVYSASRGVESQVPNRSASHNFNSFTPGCGWTSSGQCGLKRSLIGPFPLLSACQEGCPPALGRFSVLGGRRMLGWGNECCVSFWAVV